MEHCATTQRIAAFVGLLLLLGSGGGVWESYGQSLSPDAQQRLSPRLRTVALERTTGLQLGPLLTAVERSSQPTEADRYGVFIHTPTPEALLNSEIPAHSIGESLITARVTPGELRTIARMDAVRSVEPARTYTPMNDVVRVATGAHPLQEGVLEQRYTGEGVLACVIDTGIDWSHADFRELDDPESSRIRALWDQTLSSQPSEQSPSSFGYGVEYNRQDIERALTSTSGELVRSTDSDGHGTQVAATMAGNGAAGPSRTHRGMAPQTGIVAVKTDFSGVGIADGLRYCRSIAENADQPMVANLSLGSAAGPHDGTSSLAHAVNAFTGPGRSVVAAAGNSGDEKHHLTQAIPAEETDSLTIQVPPYTPQEGRKNDIAFRVDTWSDGNAVPTAVVTPGGERVPLSADTAAVVPTAEGTVVYEREVAPPGNRHVEVLAYDATTARPPASGTWTLVVTNSSAESSSLHGWMAETTTQSTLPEGTRESTLTLPATARSALTVGAWTQRKRWQTASGTNVVGEDAEVGRVAPFSGRGPIRGGGRKPDLVAPGQWSVSARSHSASLPSEQRLKGEAYSLFRGTSTAAAASAGAVALLLQEDPSLTTDRITQLLTENAETRGDANPSWTPQRGYGHLDVFGAMADLRDVPVATRAGQMHNSSVLSDDRTAHTVGGAGAEALSVRFSPNESGTIDGIFVQTASGSANRLQDSLTVTIRIDEEGTPGPTIGSEVEIAPGAFSNHTTNFVSLTESGAVVQADTAYHVVLTSRDDGGELDIAGDRQEIQGRSFTRIDGSWTSLSADLGLRISTSLALDLSAPRLSDPSPAAILESSTTPTLTWTSVQDAETYTVRVSTSAQFLPAQTDTLHSTSTSLRLPDRSASRGYYWRVRADRLGHSGPWSSSRAFLYYPTTIDVRAQKSFDREDRPSVFRLVGLPGRRTRALKQTVAGRTGTDWQAYWDGGRSRESLLSFDGSSTFHFRPGNGFWLRSTRSWSVRDAVPSVPLQDDGTYTIALHEGWNIISNPFDLDVSWSAVEAVNDQSLPPLWRFSGHFEQTNTFSSAQSGTAFYFLNDQGREALRLPYPAYPETPTGPASAKSSPAALTLSTLRSGTTTSQVQLGVHSDAANGRDIFDKVAPPSRFSQTSLRISSGGDDTPSREQQLAAEYRSDAADGHTYTLTLQAKPGAPLEIRAEGLAAFEGQEIVLIDPSTGESHDLRTSPTLTLRPKKGSRLLRLLVGSSDYVESKQEVALPSDLQFLPNYPNPFSQQTTLEYVLPDPSSVRLAVYDVLGRQVRVLVDKKQQAGRHTVQWNGRDESGRRMASGMYLARLVVGGTTKVRKMTFVR